MYNENMKTWDVIIIGAGIIGLSAARELRRRGFSVLIVERGEAAREASYAAAGMLVGSGEETPPALRDLAAESARLYPEVVHELEDESRIKVDFRDVGTIALESGQATAHSSNTLSASQLKRLEPHLSPGDYHSELFQESSVDPRALGQAAIAACKHRGVDMSSRDEVVALEMANGRVAGVTTKKTTFAAAIVVNCAGAWSGMIPPVAFPTRPVKGQMLAVAVSDKCALRHVVRSPDVYLVPRSGGRLLIGATVEEAGYDKRTDADTIHRLYRAALRLMPGLQAAKILEDWAGLRPGTPDALPILGATSVPGYFVATGHYRDGVLLAPITAKIMGQVISGEKTCLDIGSFSANRFGGN